MPRFEPVEPFPVVDGQHTFGVFDCGPDDGGDLVEELAEVVRALYVEPGALRETLLGALADLGGVADVNAIEAAVDRTLTAAIPEPGTHPVANLDVARNELAEVLALLALPALEGTVVPASRVRHKEIRGAPARGIDVLGIDEEPLAAVIGEVKASDVASSPPGVVGQGNGGMCGQLKALIGDSDRLLSEINWVLKHAQPANRALVARALLAHVAEVLPLIAAPVLVRPEDRHGEGDFGVFREEPAQFAPARVRFYILRVDRGLDELANAVYERARS